MQSFKIRMLALYIMAGVILGFYAIDFAFAYHKVSLPIAACLLMAFVGGVAGHLVFNLAYN
jgi:hypothetical protein